MRELLRQAIADVYRQVDAPDWASPNLDGLADALRDLSWLPAGDVVVRMPPGDGDWHDRLSAVLDAAVVESADRLHRVVVERA